ncbi:MAG: hypothetical protein KDB04_07185 [Acidimicrobiales bacterium]|nr:hypothetical protein [Acidimicrobiales bacterium]
MNRPRPIVAHLAAATALLGLVLATAGCGSDGEPDAATSTTAPPTTATSAPPATTEGNDAPMDAPDMGALRGVRYCEVLLLRQGDDGAFTADVWNTMGMSDCPQDEWDQLDASAIAEERGAVVALLNGPRFWMLDSISTELRAGAEETTFGTIGMFKAATLDLGTNPSQTPYTEREVARDTVFGFDAGSEVYELIAPDDTTYVMQARSQIVDAGLEEADLPALGDRLDLPEGWTYRVRTLDEPLGLLSTDGIATVLQDELQNTYQRVDEVA